jgi:hypothetical protein
VSDKKPSQKRHQRTAPKVALTPEQEAQLKASAAKAEADRLAEAKRLQDWGKFVEKATIPQLKGEIRRIIRKEHVKVGKDLYEPQAGLTIAFATVFATILDTTKETNPKAKLSAYPL